jgi:hypothetical protein
MRTLPILLLLAACGVSPEQAATIGVGVGVGSIAVIQRSPLDAVISVLSGRDCSIVHWDQGKGYCRPIEPPPETPPYCTRSLAQPDCWRDPAALPDRPRELADGPRTLTPVQNADRTAGWPHW